MHLSARAGCTHSKTTKPDHTSGVGQFHRHNFKRRPTKEQYHHDDEDSTEGTAITAGLWDSSQSLELGDNLVPTHAEQVDKDSDEYIIPLNDSAGSVIETMRGRRSSGNSTTRTRPKEAFTSSFEDDDDDDSSASSYQKYENDLFDKYRAFLRERS